MPKKRKIQIQVIRSGKIGCAEPIVCRVNSAQLVEHLNETEQHIRSRAAELGIPMDPNLLKDTLAGKTYEMDLKGLHELAPE